jgi:hypothetical protein
MRVSAILRQQWSLRHTLFIRQNCSLCTDAKEVMSKVWDRRPFEYTEIDVMAPGQTKWKNLYEFDTPVVSAYHKKQWMIDQKGLTVLQVHVDKVRENSQNFETTHKSGKLMHRFTEQQLEKLMDDEIMKEPDSYGHWFRVAK